MAVTAIAFGPPIAPGGGGSLAETSGPTTLTLGSIADGLAVKRVGTELVGYAPGSATLTETSGPTTMTLGSITDGQALFRSGTTIVGYQGAGALAKYILTEDDAGYPNAQALDALGGGILKANAGGILAKAIAGTDYLDAAYVAVKSSVATLTARANLKFSADFTVTDTSPDTVVSLAGGGSGAPTSAQYLALAADATLTAERVFTAGTGLTAVDSGAGAAYTLTADAVTGKAGGLTLTGGTAASENLTLQSTSHATKGAVKVLNGKALSGFEAQVTGTVSTGFALLDASAVLKGAFGLAGATNDWITGVAAGDTAVGFASGKKLQIGILAAAAPMVTVSSVGLGVGQVTPASLLHVGSSTPTITTITLQASGGTWTVGNGAISGGDGHFNLYGNGFAMLVSKVTPGGDILGGQGTYLGSVAVGDIAAGQYTRLWVKRSCSILPAAGSVYNMVDFAASTVTLDQGVGADITNVNGMNTFVVRPTTYSNPSTARTIAIASTQVIEGPPVAGSNITITAPRALWIKAGFLRLDGQLSVPTAQTQATIGANGAAAALTALPLGYIKADVNGTAVIIPYYTA